MRRLLFLFLALLTLTSTACFGGNNHERTYFSMQYPMGAQIQRYQTPRFPLTLRVQRFDSTLAYNRQEIVYRTNPHEFRYYAYKLWSARPAKMIQELFTNHLRQTNLVSNVIIDIVDHIPEYEINAELIALEELNSETEWFAHLAMRVSMLRTADNQVIWQYTFDERKPVHNQQPVFVVRAMSEIMESQMVLITEQIDHVLTKETGGKPHKPTPDQPINPIATDPATPPDTSPDTTTPPDTTPDTTTDATPDVAPQPPKPKARLKDQ